MPSSFPSFLQKYSRRSQEQLFLTMPKNLLLIPSHVPFIGHGIPFLKDFSKLMQQLRSKHGPIFTINIFGQRQHFITSYTDIQKIWKHPDFDFKEFAYKAESHFSGMESPQRTETNQDWCSYIGRICTYDARITGVGTTCNPISKCFEGCCRFVSCQV